MQSALFSDIHSILGLLLKKYVFLTKNLNDVFSNSMYFHITDFRIMQAAHKSCEQNLTHFYSQIILQSMFKAFRKKFNRCLHPSSVRSGLCKYILHQQHRAWTGHGRTPNRLQVTHLSIATTVKFMRNWDIWYRRQRLTRVRSRK